MFGYEIEKKVFDVRIINVYVSKEGLKREEIKRLLKLVY